VKKRKWILRTSIRWELIAPIEEHRYYYLGSLNKTWHGWMVTFNDEVSYLPYNDIKTAARVLLHETATITH
jgi:hypothetical protein